MIMENEIGIKQSSSREKANSWNWSIWIESTTEIMNKIAFVEYILHPSFPNRIRKRTSKKSLFKLSTKGWGEFMIYVKIYFSNEEEPLLMKHYLKLFEEDKTSKSRSVFISSTLPDLDNVEKLTSELNEKNIDVKTQDTIEVTSNFIADAKTAINESDVFILYGFNNLTRNQEYELEIAIDAKKEVIIHTNNENILNKRILKMKDADQLKVFKTNNEIIGFI